MMSSNTTNEQAFEALIERALVGSVRCRAIPTYTSI